jgi:hypothetical protein
VNVQCAASYRVVGRAYVSAKALYQFGVAGIASDQIALAFLSFTLPL